jgi:hypothetical protein
MYVAKFSANARRLTLAYSGHYIQDANFEQKNTNTNILTHVVNVVRGKPILVDIDDISYEMRKEGATCA